MPGLVHAVFPELFGVRGLAGAHNEALRELILIPGIGTKGDGELRPGFADNLNEVQVSSILGEEPGRSRHPELISSRSPSEAPDAQLCGGRGLRDRNAAKADQQQLT